VLNVQRRCGMQGRPGHQNERDRAAARWRKWNEPRDWTLHCPGCDHEGTVHTTLKRLRSSNLICSQCSRPLWRK
jgi:transcription elongation factor Elf1